MQSFSWSPSASTSANKAAFISSRAAAPTSAPVDFSKIAFPSSGPTAPAAPAPAKQQFVQRAASAQTPPAPQPTTPTAPGSTNVTTPSGAKVDPSTGAMTTPPPTQPSNNYSSAYQAYIASLSPDSDVTAAKTYLSGLVNQSKIDHENALSKGETLGFASGEAARVDHNNQFSIDAATGALSTLTDAQKATQESGKARTDFEKSMIDMSKPVSVSPGSDQYAVNPETGAYEKIASATPKLDTSITEVGGNKVLVDNQTGKTIKVLGKSTSGASGTTQSGSLSYSAQDYSDDSSQLERSRGDDGYVDPAIYQQLYNAWIKNGGTAPGFISKFPPKDYVNPANSNLPPLLRNKASAASDLSASIDALFGE